VVHNRIVPRTQIYLDDLLWKTLRDRARRERTTVPQLIREAVRAQYRFDPDARHRALLEAAGIWKESIDSPESTEYLRDLRRGRRRK
jgi:Arc/MetJ family transcription regulator